MPFSYQALVSTLPAIRSAALFVGGYFVWSLVFQWWIEPALRRCIGALGRCAIVWVPAGGGMRVWGRLRGPGNLSEDGAVSFFGCAIVLCAALAPAFCTGVGLSHADPIIAATRYLTAAPAVALFTIGVLSEKTEKADAS